MILLTHKLLVVYNAGLLLICCEIIMRHDIKVVVLGAEGSGKSSILLRAIDSSFYEYSAPTIGVKFKAHASDVSRLQIWDTSGDPRFQSLSNMYLKDASLCMYCVDLTKPFDSYKSTIEALIASRPDLKIILVGTKSDLQRDAVIRNELVDFASQKGLDSPFITSAKENINITELFGTVHRFNCPLEDEDSVNSELAEEDSMLGKCLRVLDHSAQFSLTEPQYERISNEIETLEEALQNSQLTIDEKQTAIQTFENNCNDVISVSVPTSDRAKVLKAIAAVAAAALVTILAAAIGFGIGFAAGLWTGPGAFISGVLAGGTAAVTVAAASASLGVGAGMMRAHGLFKTTKITPEDKSGLELDIFSAAWAAKQDFRCPSPSF